MQPADHHHTLVASTQRLEEKCPAPTATTTTRAGKCGITEWRGYFANSARSTLVFRTCAIRVMSAAFTFTAASSRSLHTCDTRNAGRITAEFNALQHAFTATHLASFSCLSFSSLSASARIACTADATKCHVKAAPLVAAGIDWEFLPSPHALGPGSAPPRSR